MPKIELYICIILFICFSEILTAQKKNSSLISDQYDAQLYNGELYNLVKQKNIKGHPFYIDEEFFTGDVKIKGIVYSCPELNYDIFNQKLILKYQRSNGYELLIALSDAWLEEFTIRNSRFIIDNDQRIIYQVIGTGSIRILYHWKKTLTFKSSIGESSYFYSAPIRDSFIEINGNKYKYNNNRGFLTVFKNNDQIRIKKFMKDNKINVKDASDESMLRLILFCENFKEF